MDVSTSHRHRRENELITPDRGQLPPTFPIKPIAHNDAKKAANVELANHYRVPPSIGREKEKEDRERVLAKVNFVQFKELHADTHTLIQRVLIM